MADMLLTIALGCQRRQKSAPKGLPEIGLSLTQLASLHVAADAPVEAPLRLPSCVAPWDPPTPPVALLLDSGLCWQGDRGSVMCGICPPPHVLPAKQVTLPGATEAATGTHASSYDACRHPVSVLTARQQQMYFSSRSLVQAGPVVSMFATHL